MTNTTLNDIVITYDSKQNSENRLRQIIRGIENDCSGYNEIYIVGDKPDWLQGVVHIGFSDCESKRFHMKNKYRKLKAAILNSGLTENFYWIDSDDDIPVFDATDPMRICIDESSIFNHKPKGTDKICLEHTNKLMSRRGFSKKNYFNRFPMSLNKDRLRNTFDDIDFETMYGYCIKTMYANFNRLQPTSGYIPTIDLTVYTKPSTYEKIN